MPGIIRSNSAEVSQRRPVLGFTVRTGGHPFFEVAVATAPDLFRPEARGRRTPGSFWSSRGAGPLAAERGEAVYMLPADVLLRFAGAGRLYYTIATFPDAGRGNPSVQLPAPELAPYVTVSPDFSARTARVMAGAGAGGRWNGGGYGAGEAPAAGASLEWAGDAARPGVESSTAAPAPGRNGHAPAHNGNGSANGNGNGNGNGASSGNGASNGNGSGAAVSAGLAYDDGFDPDLWSRPMTAEGVAAEQDEDPGPGIEGPIPDDETVSSGQAWAGAMTTQAPEYPGASRFVPAHSGNFRSRRGTRTVRRVVIHITDGNRRIEGPISWFQNPRARVSAHYIVGQDGEVVQMVRHDDVAWHAGSANGDSIGIEHVASRGRNILPTTEEYCASARLVRWLCQQYGLPLDRQHIVGHSEADTRTTHTGCPASAWDWDYFMGLVLSADPEACRPAAGAQSLGAAQRIPVGRIAPRALDGDEDDPGPGIEGPIPDDGAVSSGQGWAGAMAGPSPEYPGASRFVPAHTDNYRAGRGTRTIRRVVIHITDGNRSIEGPISWFRDPRARASSHYVVGLDGEVVQMVRHDDVAWHASNANPDSIGIEHVASRQRNIFPTVPEYCASARLVRWLCQRYGLPLDRQHIVGHSEADTRTNHTGCPATAWDWDYFMGLVLSDDPEACRAPAGAQSLSRGTTDPDDIGIDGPIPDAPATATQQGYAGALTGTAPEYPSASRFVPAGTGHYTVGTGRRAVQRIVIHITDGTTTAGTISWFQNPANEVSSHYLVGQDGEVVQMVRHDDIAHHARGANRDSIGIEHVASVSANLWPSDAEYCASAALVRWLCDQYGLPYDRAHIVGHSEVGTSNHANCPQARWNWDHFMGLVTSGACSPQTVSTQQGYGAARALNRSVDFDWDDLELMGQPNDASCWATAASMLLNWKAQATTATPRELAHSIGMDHEYANGCAPHRRRDVARALGLLTAPPQSWTVDAFIDLVQSHGPLFVAARTPWNHVVVVTGILSDGSPDGSDTRVRIADPWDRAPGIAGLPDNYRPNPGGGSRYTLSWADFTRMYEDRASTGPDGSVNVQILHHADTGGRRPSMGSRHAYSAGVGGASHAMSAPVVSAGAAVVGGVLAGITTVTNNQGDVRWTLERWMGIKDPRNDPSLRNPVGWWQDAPGIRITDIKGTVLGHNDIYCNLQVDYQFNGTSVASVRVDAIESDDAPLAALSVEAKVYNDERTMAVPNAPEFEMAVLRVVITYAFAYDHAANETRRVELELWGNGRYNRRNG